MHTVPITVVQTGINEYKYKKSKAKAKEPINHF